MKISELMQTLEQLMEQHGDIPVINLYDNDEVEGVYLHAEHNVIVVE